MEGSLMNAPVESPSRGLWSLWNMLLTYAKAFSVCCADLEMSRGLLFSACTHDANIQLNPTDGIATRLLDNLSAFRLLIVNIPTLNRLGAPLFRLETEINKASPALRIVQQIEWFQHAVFDELNGHVYYQVEPRLAQYYNDNMPFGELMFQNFPSANGDIRDAGRCIALGQGTAAVFHLMLVAELGLAVLARHLKIPYAPSWESYLKQIETKMTQKHTQKTPGWKKQEPFYRDVAGDLQMIKLAWRNPTMHIVRGRNYDIDQAEQIYAATRTLMQRLASRFSETKRDVAAATGVSGLVS
jgi:hypothetical protein